MGWPKGVPCPESRKRKVSRALMGHVQTPETCRKISASKTGNCNWGPETRKKMSESHTGLKQTKAHRDKVSEAMKRAWEKRARPPKKVRKKSSPAELLGKLQACAARWKKHAPKAELLLQKELRRQKIPFVSQYIVGDKYVVDVFLPTYNVAIECDDAGYFKPRKKVRAKNRDRFIKRRYKLFHFVNEEIFQDVKQVVAKVLSEVTC
jgi:very-short-patch-repair endonuclease